jgi:uncharacterized protein YndB with AHSA1/START domain
MNGRRNIAASGRAASSGSATTWIKRDEDGNCTGRGLRASAHQGWAARTDSRALAEWLMANDFELRIGKRFTFSGPPSAD